MWTSALFCDKNVEVLKLIVCLHGKEKLSQCGHFADKGEGNQFFAILWGRLLWMVSYPTP